MTTFDFDFFQQQHLSLKDKEEYICSNFEQIIYLNKKYLFNNINNNQSKFIFIKVFKDKLLNSNEYFKNKISNLIDLLEVDKKEDFLFFSSYTNLQFLFNNYYKFDFNNDDKLFLQDCYKQFNFFNDTVTYNYPEINDFPESDIALFKIEFSKSLFEKTGIIHPFLKIDIFTIFFNENIQIELFNYFLEYFQYIPENNKLDFAFNLFFLKDDAQLYRFIFPKKLYESFLSKYLFLALPLYQKIQNIENIDFKDSINSITNNIHLLYIEKYQLSLQINDF